MKTLSSFTWITFFGLLIGLYLPEAHGQSLERQVVASAGATLQTNDLSLDFTIGEMMTTTIGQQALLCQGFHQVWAVVTASEDPEEAPSVLVYPNPTPGLLQVTTGQPLVITILDMQGRILRRAFVESGNSELDISPLPVGAYVLQMRNPDHESVNTFKVMKIQ